MLYLCLQHFRAIDFIVLGDVKKKTLKVMWEAVDEGLFVCLAACLCICDDVTRLWSSIASSF